MKLLACLIAISFPCVADQFLECIIPPELSKNSSARIQEKRNCYSRLLPTVSSTPDLYITGSREPKTMSLEYDYLAMLESAFIPDCFVETGTYLGDTTSKAAQLFPDVYTIELSSKLFKKAQRRFSKNKRVHLYHGDSCTLMPDIIAQLSGTPLFFLDAHYSLGDTAQGDQNTPILHELACIQKSGLTDAIIIIDDIRMFYTPLGDTTHTFIEGYPTLQTIVESLIDINATYQCACIYDTLIAYPAATRVTVSPLVYATTLSRLYDGINFDSEEVIRAELCIAKATGDEKKVLIDLADRWTESWSESAGLSRHLPLWSGLICLYNQDFQNAATLFAQAKARGLNDWKIDWYLAMSHAECFFDIR